jgi:hypothetical protein
MPASAAPPVSVPTAPVPPAPTPELGPRAAAAPRRRRPPPIVRLRASVTSLRAVFGDPAMFLWALYVLAFPLYVFPSGMPQPGDIMVIVLAPVALLRWNGKLPTHARTVFRPLLWFTLYVLLANLTWSAILGAWAIKPKWGFLLTPTFYIYNTLIFLIAYVLFLRYGERFLTITAQLVATSLLLQTAISFVFTRGGMRGQVLFNNPNQLGYFAVLSASIILLSQRRGGISTWLASAGLLAAMYLAVFSSSKAALGSIAILLAITTINRLRTALVVGLIAGALLLTSDTLTSVIDRADDRISSDQSYGFFEERGYDRIINHPEYWLLGSGEGYYKRFDETTVIGDHELHSSAGTIFFCYGIAGSLVFLWFCFRVVKGSPWRSSLLLLPAAAYGMTHQGLRFTLLWMLLAQFAAYHTLRLAARRRAGGNAA